MRHRIRVSSALLVRSSDHENGSRNSAKHRIQLEVSPITPPTGCWNADDVFSRPSCSCFFPSCTAFTDEIADSINILPHCQNSYRNREVMKLRVGPKHGFTTCWRKPGLVNIAIAIGNVNVHCIAIIIIAVKL